MTNTDLSFKDLWLSEKILKKIEKKWYKTPSPIQSWVIPLLLNWEKDIIWQAQTGTGKTAAFALPVLDKLDKNQKEIQVLVLTPTRELAIQVAEEMRSFSDSDTKIQLLYWWQNIKDEIYWLKRNPQIVVWTPGRVIDHLTKRNTLNLDKLKYFILDEADEMLNIWFKEDIEEIIKYTPKNKKTLLFSATMPKAIKDIVDRYINDHDFISIKRKELTNPNIKQIVYKIHPKDKFEALCRIIEVEFDFYGIIFCKTKAWVDEVSANLMTRWYKVEWIHWDIEQKMREKTLTRFKNKTITILVATDVAARWIDINNLTHVVNYDLPDNPEVYTHRIWRTWRAGNKWEAISFITRKDLRILSAIERTIKTKLELWKLPEISEVIEFKKKRLINNIKEIINSKNINKSYLDLADRLLELANPNEVLASVLQEWFWNEFLEIHYKEISNLKNNNQDEKRLFIALGRNNNYNVWKLIKFIENEIWRKLWNIWKIDIMRDFSFMNVSEDDAWEILDYFKKKNPKKPLIVEAKSSSKNNNLYKKWKYKRKK